MSFTKGAAAYNFTNQLQNDMRELRNEVLMVWVKRVVLFLLLAIVSLIAVMPFSIVTLSARPEDASQSNLTTALGAVVTIFLLDVFVS